LKKPFEAENLLSLVFKIVQEKHPPIPSSYSKELSDLIDMLLEKDPTKRPTIREILKMQLIRKKAEEFVMENITQSQKSQGV